MLNETYYRKQYTLQDADTRLVMDVLSLYIYPVERHRLTSGVQLLRRMEPKRVHEIVDELKSAKLGDFTTTGNFALIPELTFQLFPGNIARADYQKMLDNNKGAIKPFYSTGYALMELQQVLTAFMLGQASQMAPYVRKLELELDEYLPYLAYMLYYEAYHPLLRLFTPENLLKVQARAVQQNLLQMVAINDIATFFQQTTLLLPASERANNHELLLLQGGLTSASHFETAVTKLYQEEKEQALGAFEAGLKQQRKTNKKDLLPASPVTAFYYAYTLSLLPAAQTTQLIAKLTAFYEKKLNVFNVAAVCLLHFHSGKKTKAEDILRIYLEHSSNTGSSDLCALICFLCLRAFHPKSKLLVLYAHLAKRVLRKSMQHQYHLLAYEYLFLLEDEKDTQEEDDFALISRRIPARPAFAQMQKTPEWERLLNVVLTVNDQPAKKDNVPNANRLVYLIDFEALKIQPMLQTLQGDTWSAGRLVALKKLKEGSVPAMTDQDYRIANTIIREAHYNYSSDTYTFDLSTWQELVSHPLLYLVEAPGTRAEIVTGVPELVINTTSRGYTFSTNIHEHAGDMVMIRETDTRYKIIKLDQQQRNLLQALNQVKVVPAEGKEKLLEAIKKIGAHLTIHSDMDETALSIRRLEADSRIRTRLQPAGNALQASIFVKPLGNSPTYCRPGMGAKNIIGIVNGERCQTLRNMEQEKQNLSLLMAAIQQDIVQEVREDDTIFFEDPADCLQLLEIIQSMPDVVVVEWPDGIRYKLVGKASFAQMHLSVKEKGHWFACTGELRINEHTVISLKQILDILPAQKTRFVELDNGEFLALTADLRSRLNELLSIGVAEHNEVKVPYFASHVLNDLLEHAGSAVTDTPWQQFRKKKNDAAHIHPVVPASLRDTLRPYQEEGFRWMAQLAAWGAGACLADDMGLGKTVQAIAILQQRAAEGPALVISPASVLPNWINELLRFAPGLRVVQLENGLREEQVKNAAAFDVIVSTYGILQSDADSFAAITWNTIVLDEAHTIKNYQTRTSKAAMQLKGHFRLALTGTPIQNSLGEIWNLFNFLNPGMLGDLPFFRKQFVTPAAQNPESMAKKHLKKLIAPFLLRRLKSDVLEELPPKTEIVKLVELSVEEASFYEALRRKALEHIQEKDDLTARQRHVRALTEITRLRLAACNPQMIEAESEIESSKLAVFMEIVEELTGNNHRALVFSQFVKHLNLVAKALDNRGVDYLYLDGATPIPTREKLVKAFQTGHAPLFLISLKAGGLGLNLTAADYVVHLDPWWNPAIEEQASDRAYRMGQTRPVTIYRLVTQHTIEEKIIELHHNKRDLADTLLEGTDQSAKMSMQELVSLIAGA